MASTSIGTSDPAIRHNAAATKTATDPVTAPATAPQQTQVTPPSYPREPKPEPPSLTRESVFNEYALYGLAGKIVRALAPHTEAQPEALLLQLLAEFRGQTDLPLSEATA